MGTGSHYWKDALHLRERYRGASEIRASEMKEKGARNMGAIKEFVKIRIKENGKWVSEIHSGDELCVAQDKWMNKNRVIDKKNDQYRETVRDPQTGEIVHHCDEPLSLHRGHGSAKLKAQT
jgi:hypothetical protein